ncbi:MAG: hypothetical protein ACR2MQ_09775 [Gemmatimonadaceae bacterium]
MIGQFIFPTCETGHLRVAAYLRNTQRDGVARPPVDVSVELQVFEKGRSIAHEPAFGTIPFEGVLEVSERTFPAVGEGACDRLVVARLRTPDDVDGYFAQEHQLTYENPRTGVFDSLLYDQLPIGKPGRRASPIILIAPKAWVGRDVNSLVAFANVGGAVVPTAQGQPLTISVLSSGGEVLSSNVFEEPENSALLFDVRAALRGHLSDAETPKMVNVVARGGASMYAIMTFVINKRTGNFALEHSLSPHYYVTDGLARVRDEALSTLIRPRAS